MRPAGDLTAFWVGPVLPDLPSHPPLPSDLLLHQLPAAALGGDLVAHLRPLYDQLAQGREEP